MAEITNQQSFDNNSSITRGASSTSKGRDLDNGSKDSQPQFSKDEEMLIIRMFNLVGKRWNLIAGRIPGRTAEEIEKYWNSRNCTGQGN